jgi:hypothetical protein
METPQQQKNFKPQSEMSAPKVRGWPVRFFLRTRDATQRDEVKSILRMNINIRYHDKNGKIPQLDDLKIDVYWKRGGTSL